MEERDAIISTDSAGDTSQRRGNSPARAFFGYEVLSSDFLLQRIRSKGFAIGDAQRASRILAASSYCHLSRYIPAVKRVFGDHASMGNLEEALLFDMTLQRVLLSYLILFERAFKTSIADGLAQEFGSFAHLRPEPFSNKELWHLFVKKYNRERDAKSRSGSPFVVHYIDEAGELPVWAAFDILSFGMASNAYGNLVKCSARDKVSSYFGMPSSVMRSWARALSHARNECAHGGVFYGRQLGSQPKRTRELVDCDTKSMYCLFVMILHLFKRNMPAAASNMLGDLVAVAGRSSANLTEPCGFPRGWEERLASIIGENGTMSRMKRRFRLSFLWGEPPSGAGRSRAFPSIGVNCSSEGF